MRGKYTWGESNLHSVVNPVSGEEHASEPSERTAAPSTPGKKGVELQHVATPCRNNHAVVSTNEDDEFENMDSDELQILFVNLATCQHPIHVCYKRLMKQACTQPPGLVCHMVVSSYAFDHEATRAEEHRVKAEPPTEEVLGFRFMHIISTKTSVTV